MPSIVSIPKVSLKRVQADGVDVFYREAGPADAPVILLMHGFPASSHMFRELIPRLAGRYRVIAPDLPGFGFTHVPKERGYAYSFDALAKTADAFVEALALKKYAPLCFRLRRARRLSPRGRASGARDRADLPKWKRVRGRARRRLGPHSPVLGHAVSGESRGREARRARLRRDEVSIPGRGAGSEQDRARVLHP